jgi:methylglyoxal synthase
MSIYLSSEATPALSTPSVLRMKAGQGQVDCVIFLCGPMTPQPHEPDINALVRACEVHNVPCATNAAVRG